MQPQALLFLLLLQHSQSDSACKNLRCFADYIQTLTCMWITGSSTPRGKLYNLTASWDCGRGGACHFLPTSGNASHTRYACSSEQRLCRFGNTFAVKGTTLVDGELPVSQECGPFQFHENIKPQSPFNVTAVASPDGYNISWESGYRAYDYLHGELQYQLRFRQKGHTWQGPKHLLQDTRTLWLLPQELQGSAEYELQVRTRPRDQSDYKGVWSDWSPQSSLRTLPRDAGGAPWLVTTALVLILMVALLAFLGWHQRPWKLENFIPNPAPFFQTLYLVHNGDFKKWAGTSRSAAVLDVYECGTVRPEVFGISQKPLLLGPAAGKAPSAPYCAACLPAFTERRLSVLESAYGRLSIDTVTVADACPERSGSPDPDAYRCLPLDGGPAESLLPAGKTPPGDSPVPYSSGPCPTHPQADTSPERRAGQLSALCGLPGGGPGAAPASSLALASKPFCREPFPPAWAAAGDPGEGLDLDTIDSGFADSDCGSPLDCEFDEGRLARCACPGAGEDRAAFLPSYVKQWVACHALPAQDR